MGSLDTWVSVCEVAMRQANMPRKKGMRAEISHIFYIAMINGIWLSSSSSSPLLLLLLLLLLLSLLSVLVWLWLFLLLSLFIIVNTLFIIVIVIIVFHFVVTIVVVVIINGILKKWEINETFLSIPWVSHREKRKILMGNESCNNK